MASLHAAKNNNWQENLSGKISESFKILNIHTEKSVNDSIELRKILENSEYKNIFNFSKYDLWIKKEILSPIDELISLIDKNLFLLTSSHEALCKQIGETSASELKRPLELQKVRFDEKITEFMKMKNLLE